MKLNGLLLRSAAVGALGGLLFGFDTAVIAGTTHQLSIVYRLSAGALGLTVSVALWGTVAGALGAGYIGQKLGGRNALRITAILYLVSAIGCALAWKWPSLVAFRFIGGVGIGGSSVLGPVYIAELAPADWRGRLVGLFQINVVLGVLAAYLSNFLISMIGLGMSEWRLQLGVAALPACAFLLLLSGVPQSGRWLISQGRIAEALAVLKATETPNPEVEVENIQNSMQARNAEKPEALLQRKYLYPIFLAVSIGMFNQLSGINAILYYLNDIFAAGGYGRVSSGLQAVFVGLMNLISTLLAMTVIDKLGRKTLLVLGSIGMTIALSGVAAVMFQRLPQRLLFPLLAAYTFSFAFSQGAVIWVYISEIFPTLVRAKGQSVGTSAHWIMNALIAGFFPLVASKSQASPFVFFAAMMFVQLIVVLMFYPETKRLSLEELQKKLGN